MTCQTCRHWNQSLARDPMRGVCKLTIQDLGGPLHAESKAVVWAPHGAECHLETTPDFSCVQWGRKLPEIIR